MRLKVAGRSFFGALIRRKKKKTWCDEYLCVKVCVEGTIKLKIGKSLDWVLWKHIVAAIWEETRGGKWGMMIRSDFGQIVYWEFDSDIFWYVSFVQGSWLFSTILPSTCRHLFFFPVPLLNWNLNGLRYFVKFLIK